MLRQVLYTNAVSLSELKQLRLGMYVIKKPFPLSEKKTFLNQTKQT